MSRCKDLDSKTFIGTGVVLGLMLLASIATVSADSPVRDDAVSAEVRIFEVAPVKRAPAILAPNAQTPVAPEPLNAQRRTQILKNIGGGTETDGAGDSGSAPITQTLVLSSQQPFIEGQAMLTLVLPASVHPETGIRFDGELDGSAAIKFMLQEGHSYLLDFAVRSGGAGSYTLETAGGSQVFDDKIGDQEHLLIALLAQSSGWTTVRLSHHGSGFYLYSAAVTTAN